MLKDLWLFNQVLSVVISTWFLAQLFKFIVVLAKKYSTSRSIACIFLATCFYRHILLASDLYSIAPRPSVTAR